MAMMARMVPMKTAALSRRPGPGRGPWEAAIVPGQSSASVWACSYQPWMVRSGGVSRPEGVGSLARPGRGSPPARSASRSERPDDTRLRQDALLLWPEVGEVQQQGLIAPLVDVVGGDADLVGQRHAPGGRLRDLQEEAGREEALVFEALQRTLRDALEVLDGGHGLGLPPGRVTRWTASL